MPVSVAKHLLERTARRGAVVLDPMVGSGTTLIAARQVGLAAMGFDIDPLAVLIARATTTSLRRADLAAVGDGILERAQARCGRVPVARLRRTLPDEDRDFLAYWFPPACQKQLFALAHAIGAESDAPGRDFAWVVFSSLIIAKSAGASYALDIPRSRPHRRLDKPVVAPFEAWPRRFKAALARLPFVDAGDGARVRVGIGDARALPLGDAHVDIVFTSPPYLNAVDYLRAHKFSLAWMQYRLADLRELRGRMIGTERGLWERDGLPPALEARLARRVEEERRRALVRRYLSDLRVALGEMARVLRPGGLSFLVLGPNLMTETRADSAEVVFEVARATGLRPIGHVVRALNRHRRSLPPPRRGDDVLGKRLRREIIVALRK